MNKDLYLCDVNEQEVLEWICENISPIAFTTRADFAYSNMYHGERDLWILDTSDVSDTSYQWDTITRVQFKHKEDVALALLRWGGSLK